MKLENTLMKRIPIYTVVRHDVRFKTPSTVIDSYSSSERAEEIVGSCTKTFEDKNIIGFLFEVQINYYYDE